jgi:hypothetical protein
MLSSIEALNDQHFLIFLHSRKILMFLIFNFVKLENVGSYEFFNVTSQAFFF